ncbi:MAG: hypothetical protein OES18_14580 [Deltaproteobacteria bacterium]|nr:hypothetical protein [Deltaproteobacteria bacterium]
MAVLPCSPFLRNGARGSRAVEVTQTFRSHSEETAAKTKREGCETMRI